MRAARSGWLTLTPESRMAMVTPAPWVVSQALGAPTWPRCHWLAKYGSFGVPLACTRRSSSANFKPGWRASAFATAASEALPGSSTTYTRLWPSLRPLPPWTLRMPARSASDRPARASTMIRCVAYWAAGAAALAPAAASRAVAAARARDDLRKKTDGFEAVCMAVSCRLKKTGQEGHKPQAYRGRSSATISNRILAVLPSWSPWAR